MGHGRKLDPEPGRCRRTDGKKWRCSKEAGSDSKYCDRHKHRSKKRSRKHVESMETADSSKGRNTIQASLRIPTNQKKLLMDSSFSLCSSPDNSFRYGHWKNEEVDNNEHVFLSNAGYGKGKGYSSSLLDDSWQLKEKSYLGFTSKEQCLQFEGLNKPSKHCQNQMFLGTEKVMHHFI
ncbi:growth-regulating factor 2-like [Impatiens glandulifera]|uniref:growth-regulating factor 2-like n=1 Tax=Impatiens glandulifera TaxID=253017 RepID=UPI001FB0BDD0|nr:growth-regulating factor 2-like [Impatiens glandulifera]